MTLLALQSRLAHLGHDPGPLDGLWGPKTLRGLLSVVAGKGLPTGRVEALAKAYATVLPEYGITTRLRVVHFVAQTAVETGYWRFLQEVGGPTYLAKYDGRKDLGNTQPGDGARFRGRGVIQCTGRSNYARYGKRLGIDLVGNPERAAEPETGTRIACLYWMDHGCNELADADDGRAISRAVNRGNAKASKPANHEAERLALGTKLKAVWPA